MWFLWRRGRGGKKEGKEGKGGRREGKKEERERKRDEKEGRRGSSHQMCLWAWKKHFCCL